MSFLKTTKPKDEPTISYRCMANGCPLNGAISTNGAQWMCSFHFRTESKKWPMMTEAIRENEAIFGILADLHKISEIEWSKDMIPENGLHQPAQRGLYMQMFDDQPELKPGPTEKKIHYEYRLMDYIAKQGSDKKAHHAQTYPTAKQPSAFHNPAEFF